MRKGRPFIEVLSSSLNEDYRFPILEILVVLYALGTFVFAGFLGTAGHLVTSEEAVAFSLVNSLTGLPVFILVVLMLKNIAYGFGNELEKGVFQTYLSYPMKRSSLLTAKLGSSLGVALLFFLGIQVFALFIMAPDVISPYLGTVLLGYAAILCYPLLVVGVVLILTMLLKRGSSALIAGIVLYFASGILSGLLSLGGEAPGSGLTVRAFAIIHPTLALQRYYTPGLFGSAQEIWIPELGEAILYVGAGYGLVATAFVLGYVYFSRRLET